MSQAIQPHSATHARILHPDDVIRRVGDLRRDLLASLEGIEATCEAELSGGGTPEAEGVADVANSYISLADILRRAILDDLYACSVETLGIKAMLLDAVPAADENGGNVRFALFKFRIRGRSRLRS
jgi:hypothetical protein